MRESCRLVDLIQFSDGRHIVGAMIAQSDKRYCCRASGALQRDHVRSHSVMR